MSSTRNNIGGACATSMCDRLRIVPGQLPTFANSSPTRLLVSEYFDNSDFVEAGACEILLMQSVFSSASLGPYNPPSPLCVASQV